ncbi:MAG: hypothetical protein ACYCVY_13075 [Acidiferrobacteraceae bacterium]
MNTKDWLQRLCQTIGEIIIFAAIMLIFWWLASIPAHAQTLNLSLGRSTANTANDSQSFSWAASVYRGRYSFMYLNEGHHSTGKVDGIALMYRYPLLKHFRLEAGVFGYQRSGVTARCKYGLAPIVGAAYSLPVFHHIRLTASVYRPLAGYTADNFLIGVSEAFK